MLFRTWHGWTDPSAADAYERLLDGEIVPAITARGIDGLHHVDILRREAEPRSSSSRSWPSTIGTPWKPSPVTRLPPPSYPRPPDDSSLASTPTHGITSWLLATRPAALTVAHPRRQRSFVRHHEAWISARTPSIWDMACCMPSSMPISSTFSITSVEA